MTNEEKLVILAQHATQLSEHFASVQIIVVNDNVDTTTALFKGAGCWYSRMGAVSEFLLYHKEQMREKARSDMEIKNE